MGATVVKGQVVCGSRVARRECVRVWWRVDVWAFAGGDRSGDGARTFAIAVRGRSYLAPR